MPNDHAHPSHHHAKLLCSFTGAEFLYYFFIVLAFHLGPTIFPSNYFGEWDSVNSTVYHCSGNEQSLQECYSYTDYYLSHYCNSYYYNYGTVGLSCNLPLSEGEALNLLEFMNMVRKVHTTQNVLMEMCICWVESQI